MKEHTIYLTTKAKAQYAGTAPMANATVTPVVPKKPEQETASPPPKKEAPKKPPVVPAQQQAAEADLKRFTQAYLKERHVISEEELPSAERQTLEAIKKLVKEKALRIPLGRFGAEALPTHEFTHPRLIPIVEEINEEAARLGDKEFPVNYLEQQRLRIQGLIDKGEFGADTSEARGLIRILNQRIDVAGPGRDEEGDENGREGHIAEMVRKEMAVPLSKGETRTFNPGSFRDPDVLAVAYEVDRALTTGKEATHVYLSKKIQEVAQEIIDLTPRQAEPEIRRKLDEYAVLNRDIQQLKNILWAKIAQARGDELRNIYGEIRPSPAKTLENIQNAIDSIRLRKDGEETPESEKAAEALDEAFNKLFTRATINANSEWRDALGSAGQIEFDLFFMGLGNAAADSTLPLGHELTQKEKDAVNQKIRELKTQAEYREFSHNLNYYINRNANTEEMHGAIKRFPAESMDKAYSIKGVTQMDHFFEQAMFQVMTENAGYLPYEAMVTQTDGSPGRVEELVREMAKDAVITGILPKNMQPWEIDRALSLARGLRIANGRALEVVSQGGIPRETPLVSWWANNIIKKLAVFRQIARYNVGFERNRILAYKLENTSPFWSISELAKMTTQDIIDRFTVESNEDRFMDMINPMMIGGIKTQTGWRYQKDRITNAGVISELLRNYEYNPIIGVGMWMEKERKNLVPTAREKAIKNREKTIAELKRTFHGKDHEIDELKTNGELATFLIGENLDLAAKILPLKLFYNLKGMRQQVLAKHYADQIEVDGKIEEGQIVIKKGSNLDKDLKTLALAQEKLQQKRVDVYLKWEKSGKNIADRPDLYTQHTDLEAEIREVCQLLNEKDPTAGDRPDNVITLAKNISNEFEHNLDYGKEKLLENLTDKGWKVPYIFGEDDIPQHLYRYGKTGGSSVQRRWGDMESADKAAGKLEEFIMNMTMFRTQDDIIKGLNDIYQTLRGHDEGVASNFIFRLSEGVIKFYKKDVPARLPFGIGTLKGFLGGKTSYAQVIGEREQMAWDEIDIDAFIKRLHAAKILGPNEDAEERIKELRNHTGSEWWNILLIAFPRTGGSLGLLGLIIYMLSKTMPEEFKKAA